MHYKLISHLPAISIMQGQRASRVLLARLHEKANISHMRDYQRHPKLQLEKQLILIEAENKTSFAKGMAGHEGSLVVQDGVI
jgi:hypothetical protein